jgi:8-oxo-dGDP phosphatase
VSITTLSSRLVYRDPWLSLREDRVRRADGSLGVYSVLDVPDFALVVPVEDDGYHLVEQYRYPVGRYGTSNSGCHVFVATDLTAGTPRREVSEQDMRHQWFPRAEVERMVREGAITDAPTVAACALLALRR